MSPTRSGTPSHSRPAVGRKSLPSAEPCSSHRGPRGPYLLPEGHSTRAGSSSWREEGGRPYAILRFGAAGGIAGHTVRGAARESGVPRRFPVGGRVGLKRPPRGWPWRSKWVAHAVPRRLFPGQVELQFAGCLRGSTGDFPAPARRLGEGETRRAGLGREERRERRREESLPDGKIALFGLFFGLNAKVP